MADMEGPASLQVEKLTLADVRETREQGDYPKALEQIAELDQALHIERGLCFYHQGRYAEALQEAQVAGETNGSLQLQLHVYSYAEGFRDQNRVRDIAERLGDTVGALNSEVVSAIQSASSSSASDLLWRGEPLLYGLTPDNASVTSAHLAQNLARLVMDGLGDLPRAEKLIDLAITLYGDETHLHHRGAAHFWKTQILERQGKIAEAVLTAEEAVRLWEEQVHINPEDRFRQRLEGAQNRLADLVTKSRES